MFALALSVYLSVVINTANKLILKVGPQGEGSRSTIPFFIILKEISAGSDGLLVYMTIACINLFW